MYVCISPASRATAASWLLALLPLGFTCSWTACLVMRKHPSLAKVLSTPACRQVLHLRVQDSSSKYTCVSASGRSCRIQQQHDRVSTPTVAHQHLLTAHIADSAALACCRATADNQACIGALETTAHAYLVHLALNDLPLLGSVLGVSKQFVLVALDTLQPP